MQWHPFFLFWFSLFQFLVAAPLLESGRDLSNHIGVVVVVVVVVVGIVVIPTLKIALGCCLFQSQCYKTASLVCVLP